jgi:hypothetical protein
MENPVGSLRKRPFMRTEEWLDLTDLKPKTVDYCAYGAEVRKSRNIRTTIKGWEPRGNTGNGRCKCNEHTGEKQHAKVIAGDADRAFKGPQKKQQIWRMPELLCEELMEQVTDQRREPTKRHVLDLFAGGELAQISRG